MEKNIIIDGVFYSPFHPKHGKGKYLLKEDTRKPGSGMFEEAFRAFNINKDNSIMIGDKITDIEAGQLAGIKDNLLLSNNTSKLNKKIEEAIIHACEQSGCNFMPTVQYFKDLDNALNHVMEESKSEDVFVLDTIADKLSGNLLKSNAKMISFITGPESGFSTNERKLMAQKKLSNFCLGHYILRAETAPLDALSKLHTLNGENV